MEFYNPNTGRKIKYNGPTYKRLVKEGKIPLAVNPNQGGGGKGKKKATPKKKGNAKRPTGANKVTNPITGRKITVGGKIYNDLKKKGHFAPPKSRSPRKSPPPKRNKSPSPPRKSRSKSPSPPRKSRSKSPSPPKRSRSRSRDKECMICMDEVEKGGMAYVCKDKKCGKGICKDCKGGMIDLRCPNCRRDFEEEEVKSMFSPRSKRKQEQRKEELRKDIEREKTANDELIAAELGRRLMEEANRNPYPAPQFGANYRGNNNNNNVGRGRGRVKKPAVKKPIKRRQ